MQIKYPDPPNTLENEHAAEKLAEVVLDQAEKYKKKNN